MIDLEADAGVILEHLTKDQQQRLSALDAAYCELLSNDSPPTIADFERIEALADAVVTLYDEIAGERTALENPA